MSDIEYVPAPSPTPMIPVKRVGPKVPRLALIFGIVSAAWWALGIVSFLLSTLVADTSFGSVFAYLLTLLAVPCFGLWVAALVLGHRSLRRGVVLDAPDRGRAKAALVLAYAQTPFILLAVLALVVGILFFSALAGAGSSV